jgi:hypothetical protein
MLRKEKTLSLIGLWLIRNKSFDVIFIKSHLVILKLLVPCHHEPVFRFQDPSNVVSMKMGIQSIVKVFILKIPAFAGITGRGTHTLSFFEMLK